MKVVLNGKEKVYTNTCIECNSDFEYTEEDVFYVNEEHEGGLHKTVSHLFKPDEHYVNVYLQEFRCVKCPVCGHIIKKVNLKTGLPIMRTIGWKKST
jgi:hypothetical protein